MFVRSPAGDWKAPAVGLLGIALLGLLGWSVGIGPRRLRVERHVARLPRLPDGWEGEDVALLSDVQLGMPLGNEAVAARAVRHIVRQRPAAVLLAGDFILHTPKDATDRLEAAVDLLRPLTDAGLPVFAVLGNHDYQREGDAPRTPPLETQITAALTGIAVTVLRNEVAEIPPRRRGRNGGSGSNDGSGSDGTDATPLFVVGLGAHRMQDDDVPAALAGLPQQAARIVLMHNPETFPRLPPRSAPLAVAGHTHGAQVRLLPGSGVPLWMRLLRMPADQRRGPGWVDPAFGAPGNRLYISRGIGFSKAPVRLNAPPELTYFTLRRDVRETASY
jgi:uncharacterized protein